ncbi:MAG TPA: TetR/AcrR family transcriptional regulator [Bauldia sp.]|nr:TetR/AcrR family transcriptional regulator [Bauldia sp.]
MARKSTPRRPRQSKASSGASPHDRAIDALLALAAARDFSRITLADIAAEAGLSLAELRAVADGRFSLLRDFSRRIDEAVLAKGPAEGEEPRDRLFDIYMRRFDALQPYRAALRRLSASARRDPLLAAALHRLARRSQMWMLAAAGVSRGGIAGRVTGEGMVLLYADVMRTFLDDEDPGLARTMAALDRGLTRGETWVGWLDRLCSFLPDLGGRLNPRSAGADA